jgi:lysophospholipase L1-like esterase
MSFRRPGAPLALAASVTLLAAGAPGTGHAASPPPFVYTALGDSTGVGVGAREGGYVAHVYQQLITARPGAQLVNLCRSGATSAGVLAAQVPRVRASTPGLITIGVGVNDLSRQVPVEVFAQRLEEIVTEVQGKSRAPIVISNLPDVSLAPVVPALFRPAAAQLVRAYNEVIATLARRHGLTLVDMYTPSQREIPAHPEFFSSDGFHPSDAGYRFWAALMWPHVRARLSSDAPAPASLPSSRG